MRKTGLLMAAMTVAMLASGAPAFAAFGAIAYDQATGKEVGNVLMPAAQSGSPMTYMVNGKQYIIVAVSGGDYSGEYICYTLPDN